MATDIDKRRFIDVCREIELTMGRLYRRLAVAHAYDPVIAELWSKTAREEDSHAAQYRLGAPLLDAMLAAPRFDLGEGLRLLGEAEDILGRIDREPPGIVEALEMAVALERAFASFHMPSAFSFSEESHRRLAEAMMDADNKHVEELEHTLREYKAKKG